MSHIHLLKIYSSQVLRQKLGNKLEFVKEEAKEGIKGR
jgi:hypothetical protein